MGKFDQFSTRPFDRKKICKLCTDDKIIGVITLITCFLPAKFAS